MPMMFTAALWLAAASMLLTSVPARVALAQHAEPARKDTLQLDTETPGPPSAANPKPRYAGWLLGAYLVPPALAITGIAAHSSGVALGGAALMWLAPAAVHLIAGEYRLAARTAFILLCAAGGIIVGALIGLALSGLIPENANSQEEDPAVQRAGGLVFGGIVGGMLGMMAWAFVDVSDAFRRDAKRRERESKRFSFTVRPEHGGVSVSLHRAF